MNKKDIIICRCEDVSLADIHEALDMGYRDFESIKRILRVGMGPCQGQTCAHLVKNEIARYNKVNPESVKIHKTRPLISGVVLKDIAKGDDDE
ncbi:(2Fe-2S)-binding protein [Mycoplasmatota bacterium]|nr:(2Fe-2S)-binding protein [Mycoplasmatota bacterium]